MARLRIAPIVEGQGEVSCARTLLREIWRAFIDHDSPEILPPLRKHRSQLALRDNLRRSVEEATTILAHRSTPSMPGLVLVLLDADEDCPAELGTRLAGWAQGVDARFEVACIVANLEFETSFVASAESLVKAGLLAKKGRELFPDDPEGLRLKKKWVEERYRIATGRKYEPPIDQLPMTKAMDLHACRANSPSFDKLCRELEKRKAPVGPTD